MPGKESNYPAKRVSRSEQERSYTFPLALALFLFFFVSTATIPDVWSSESETPKKTSAIPKKVSLKFLTYETEKAEYFYHTGDYLNASVFSGRILEKISASTIKNNSKKTRLTNRVLLLKWLSDLKLNYTDKDLPGFRSVTLKNFPSLGAIFETLYARGDYDVASTLLAQVRGKRVKYLKSLAMYKDGDLDAAERMLKTIKSNEVIFPYAGLMLAQITVSHNKPFKAIKFLRTILKKIPNGEGHDAVSLYLGYLLFDKEKYQEADTYLRFVPSKSLYYRSAVTARIWANAKDNKFEVAINLIRTLKPLPFHEKNSHELMLVEAFSYFKLNRFAEAEEAAKKLVTLLLSIEESYNSISSKKVLPKTLLLDVAKLRDAKSLKRLEVNDTSTKTLTLTQGLASEPDLQKAVAYYKAFSLMKELFMKKEAEITLTHTTLSQSILSHREGMVKAKKKAYDMKSLVEKVAGIVYQENSMKLRPVQNKVMLENIGTSWEKELNRRLTRLERRILHMVALDGQRGLNYLENTVYCQFLFWMAVDDTKERHAGKPRYSLTGYGEGLLEKIALDIESVARGSAIAIEKDIPDIEESMQKKLEDDMRSISELTTLREKTREYREVAKETEEAALSSIAKLIKRHASVAGNEVKPIRRKARSLLIQIKKASNAGMIPGSLLETLRDSDEKLEETEK